VIECPDYGDVCLVPRAWYPDVENFQIVRHAHEYGFHDELTPVVLLGARHCRLYRAGSAGNLGYRILLRYIRVRRVTELDPVQWNSFIRRTILPMARCAHWYNHRRWTIRDIEILVNPNRVLIDGEPVVILDKHQMANVRKLAAQLDRLDKMEKSFATPCKP
jgi:hypothetical protein